MASVSTTRSRATLFGLALAGALAGSAGGAAAQYYYDDYEYEFAPPAYRYEYGYGRRYSAGPLSPRMAARIAVHDYGLVQVERTIRARESYVVEGRMANGRRTRLIVDLYSGDLIRRVNLQPPGQGEPVAPPIGRLDPAEPRAAQPRLLPLPPQRPRELRPPAEANIPPQTVVPAPEPSPASTPGPAKPPEPPAEAAAPATPMPSSPAPAHNPAEPAVPPASAPPVEAAVPPPTTQPAAPTAPEPEQGSGPRLVNPQDVRGTGEPERTPPLARADSRPAAPARAPEAAPAPPSAPAPAPGAELMVPFAPVE